MTGSPLKRLRKNWGGGPVVSRLAIRVSVSPNMLLWAVERSGVPEGRVRQKFSKFDEWLNGDRQPTLKQLELFAKATFTPIGFFFLSEPIEEHVPIPDFRTLAGRVLERPSANLLETIYVCQQRQDWFREHVRQTPGMLSGIVGSASMMDKPARVAERIRGVVDFSVDARRQFSTWTDALRHMIERVDEAGILVMTSGIVGSNTHRKLDPDEFRGFALVDDLAPLIFINGADTKAAQMFTLAHELAHVWLGETGLSDISPSLRPDHDVERWCNEVAAELLVPLEALRKEVRPYDNLTNELDRLARVFKVSTLVVLRRMKDADLIGMQEFQDSYRLETTRLIELMGRSGGGDFYRTTSNRVSKRFARAVIASAWEAQTTFTEAFHLLNCSKTSTLREMGQRLGVDV